MHILIRYQIKKALVDFNEEALFPTDDEVSTIKDLVEALSIVEAGSRSLCAQKETLATADLVSLCHKSHFLKVTCNC